MKKFIKWVVLASVAILLAGIGSNTVNLPVNTPVTYAKKAAKKKPHFIDVFYWNYGPEHSGYKPNHNKQDTIHMQYIIGQLEKRGFKFNKDFSEGKKQRKYNLKVDKKEYQKRAKSKIIKLKNSVQRQSILGKRIKTMPKKLRAKWGGPQSLAWKISKYGIGNPYSKKTKGKVYKKGRDTYFWMTSKNKGFKFWIKKVSYKGKRYRILVHQNCTFLNSSKPCYKLDPPDCYITNNLSQVADKAAFKNKKFTKEPKMILADIFQVNRRKLRLSLKEAITMSKYWVVSY